MTTSAFRALAPALAALAVLAVPRLAAAQEASGGVLPSVVAPAGVTDRVRSFKDDMVGLFGGAFGDREPAERVPGDGRRNGTEKGPEQAPVETAQMSAPDLIVRLDQMENQIRQLTGAIEQLQYRNQQLEQMVRRMQEDAGGARPPQPSRPMAGQPGPAMSAPMVPGPAPQPALPGRRSDVFDPGQSPNAPGAPRQLGSIVGPSAPPLPGSAGTGVPADEVAPIGAPGGRQAGAPLDLSTSASSVPSDPSTMYGGNPPPDNGATLPPPPPRNPNATGGQMAAVAPPSQSPKDEYDLAYGYVLRKDYALAEQTFRGFLSRYPSDRLAADAQYWLGESLFQRQRFRDSAEAFLNVTTKYETAAKAPEALLRLGQSLAALGEKEAACATLGEVTRKYPRAPPGVKQGVEREQKRGHC